MKVVEERKNCIGHVLYECSFNQRTPRWNGCVALDTNFEVGVAKIQRINAVDLKNSVKYGCQKLLKSYSTVEDEDGDEDKSLVEPIEVIDDDALNMYLRMEALPKNNRKHKMNDTKNLRKLYIYF